MSDKIFMLRIRAFIGLVIVLLIAPFVTVWNAAPYIWDDLRESFGLHIEGSIQVAWAIVLHGDKAKDYVRASK